MLPTSVDTVLKSFIPANDLLTEDEINELIYWRDQHTFGSFRIGRIALERDEYFKARGYIDERGRKVSKSQILARIGSVCGRSRPTVSLYYDNAKFYPADIENQYPTLAFCHFDFARSQPTIWKEILEYASRKPQISEEELFVKFPPLQISTERPTDISSEDSQQIDAMDDDCVIIPENYSEASKRVLAYSSVSTFLDACVRVRNELDEVLGTIRKQELSRDLLVAKDQIEAAEIALRRALPTITKALNRQL